MTDRVVCCTQDAEGLQTCKLSDALGEVLDAVVTTQVCVHLAHV